MLHTHSLYRGLILTWVFWILKSTEALLTASSLGILCSMAAGTLLCYTARIYSMNVSHQGGLTHISVWSEPRWHSLWYRWSGCPAAPLCLQKNTLINLQSDTKNDKWGKGRKWLKKIREKLGFMNETQNRSNRCQLRLNGADNFTSFVTALKKIKLLMLFFS